jgi:hypothetical protein
MELKNVKIKSIGEIKTFGGAGFKVVKFVVVDDSSSEYPQYLELQCTQDKADNLIKFNKVGDVVDCSINLRGREWINPQGETKVFNTIEAWKVFKSEGATASTPPAAFQPATDINEEEQDDLPF